MKPAEKGKFRLPVLAGTFVLAVLALGPLTAQAAPEPWLEHISQLTQYHQELARFQGKDQAYVPYLAQLEQVRDALNSGDPRKTYVAMNRFMDMLEADAHGGEGIPRWSATFLFDYCGQVTPPIYLDVSRHLPRL